MRSALLIAALAVSTAIAAEEHRYVVPVAGYIATDDGTYYYATTVIQNLSPRNATVTILDAYPLYAGRLCASGEAITIPARGRVTIGPETCMAFASAIELVSDESLSVRTELDTHKNMVAGWDKQIVPASTDWIPADVAAVTEAVIREDGPRKASLLVINPSLQTLTLTIETARPEFDLTATTTVSVPPHALQFVSLAELRHPAPPPFIFSQDGRHLLRITGNGPWQGGVSSVFKGPSMYVPAIRLEE